MGNQDVPVVQELSMYKQAIRNRWDVPDHVRQKVVQRLHEIVDNADGQSKPKDIVSASKTLADIANQQTNTDIAVTNLEMRIEEHKTLRTFEHTMTADFATGPKVALSYVDDTPLESEVIDVEVDE